MKKLSHLLVFLFLVSIKFSSAQMIWGNSKDVEELKEKTLLVVQYDNAPKYNAKIKSLVDSTWHYSEYQFINEYEISKYLKRKDVALLGVNQIKWNTGQGAYTPPTPCWGLLFDFDYGGADTYAYYNGWNEHQINYFFSSFDSLKTQEVAHRCDALLSEEMLDVVYHSVLWMLKSMSESDFEFKVGSNLYKKLNEKFANVQLVKGKKLVIKAENIPVKYMKPGKGMVADSILFKENFLNKYYGGGVQIVSNEEFSTIIKNKQKNVVYLTAEEFSIYDPYSQEPLYFFDKTTYGQFDPIQRFIYVIIHLNKGIYGIENEMPQWRPKTVIKKN